MLLLDWHTKIGPRAAWQLWSKPIWKNSSFHATLKCGTCVAWNANWPWSDFSPPLDAEDTLQQTVCRAIRGFLIKACLGSDGSVYAGGRLMAGEGEEEEEEGPFKQGRRSWFYHRLHFLSTGFSASCCVAMEAHTKEDKPLFSRKP